MKKIMLSLAVIAIVAVGAIGATRAYFSSTVTVSGNTFKAGSMSLKIDGDPSSTVQTWVGSFTNSTNPFANVKPGDGNQQILDIMNQGTVDGNATIKFDVTSWSALADNLNFTVTYDKLNNGVFDTAVASGPLSTWNHNTYTLGALGAGKIGSVKIAWSVPETAGNNIQGASVTIDTTLGLTQSIAPSAPIVAASYTTGFESSAFSTGNINGQNVWMKTGSYDAAVVSSPVIAGAQSLRISNAVTSGSFGDQTFAPLLSSGAGETGIASNKHFEAQFDIASTMTTEQPGLSLSVSPDNGSGQRMSYLRFEDKSNGIHVFFDDATDATLGSAANFNENDIATISRSAHTIKFVMDFVDGSANDVVKIYIDGVLIKTGTSWEDFYRNDPEQAPHVLFPVKTLLFRAAGTAASTSGKGFLFDNVSLSSSL